MKPDDEFKAMANGLNIISKLKAAKASDATRIAELEAQAAAERALSDRLAGALKPFADACTHLGPTYPEGAQSLDGFLVTDFFNAGHALTAHTQARKKE